MKKYDFEKIFQFIEKNKEEIKTANLGMEEDWFWTAETIFKDGEYLLDLKAKDIKIAGIDSSSWATPTLLIEYKDGKEVKYPSYIGESEGVCPSWLDAGPLSCSCNSRIASIESGEIEQ